jgi:NAD(P)-dependent dehydrogenase (short-subunit alcohol dehydrogenase family)
MTTKRALVTGCSTGFGRATALELSARGWQVVASARRMESIAHLDVAGTVVLDVDSDESVAAALGVEGSIEEVPLDDVRRAMETNFFGTARMVQAFIPAMRERGSGTVVNVTSVAGVVAGPLAGFYAATKFAVEALSEALHLEVGHFGIRVMIVEPGGFETEFGSNMLDHRGHPGPYAALAELWDGALNALRSGEPAPGPEVVATAICDALDSGQPPLRLPVGADAEIITAARNATSYPEFEATMRQTLGLDW